MRIFLRMAALFWKYRRRALLAYFCLFAGVALALVIPRLTGRAIDQALSSTQRNALVFTALMIIGAGVLRSILSYWQTYLSEYLSQKVAYDLRNQFYNHLQRLSYAFHDHSQTGQLMSRATADVEGVRSFVGFALLRGVYFFILLIAIPIVLFSLNWRLALISLCILPFISFRTIAINQRLRVLWAQIQQGLGVLGTVIEENIVGSRVVRAFAREQFESQKFRKQAEYIYDREITANTLLASNSPLMSLSVLLAMAAILWYGGRLVVAGTLTQGELVQFLLYLVMLEMPVRMLGWLVTLYSRASASGKRVFEILDQKSPVVDQPDAVNLTAGKGSIAFEDVSFGYNSDNSILKNISFTAKPGEIIALVGASGSGKSSIVNLIPRFYDVISGRITFDDIDVRNLSLASLRRHIGIVQQDTFLFSATIRENICYGRPDAAQEDIIAAAKVARLHDFISSLPNGYETWVGERGITLSGGQKQRLAIARTILLNPRILIMDDSTSSVDTETEHFIRDALAELQVGRTTFIIAHRLRSVEMADLILVLKNGQVVERGTHRELLAQNGEYRQLYTLQFQYDEEEKETAAPVAQVESEVVPAGIKESLVQNTRGRYPDSLTGSDSLVYGKPYDSKVIGRIARYFTPYKVALPLTIVATLLYTFSIVANPYLVGVAENKYILSGNLAGLNTIVLLFVANALLNWISYYTQIRAEARLGQSILLNLRSQIFDHLQRLSAKFFDHNEAGRIMSRVQNDVGELGDFLDSGAFWVIGEVVTLVAIMVVLFVMDLRLALLALSVLPLLLLFIVFWQTRARQSFIKVRQALSGVNASLQASISGVRVIQSLSREDLNTKQFDQVNQANFQANLQSVMISAAMSPVVEMLVATATGLVLVFGGGRVFSGAMLLGTLMAFLLYIQTFFDPIRTLTMEYTQLQRVMASGSRVFELLDVKPEMAETSESRGVPNLTGEVKFEGVSFSYETGVEILHDINLDIPAGKTIALVGPTGAGKSTVISLIARFYDVSQGRILIDGHDLRSLDKTSYRRRLGLVLQDPFLFSGTIRDNIRFGNLEATEEEIVTAAKTVGADQFIRRLEKGYDTELEERGQNLSMGQRQLISFVRALVAQPAILLLDEATANVDSYSEHVLQAGIRNLRKGRTTIVIAHRLSTVRDADRIVVLDKGRIVEAGKHEELLALGGLYTRLYKMTYAKMGK
jgi:ATP-binding cassette subfamily B protein